MFKRQLDTMEESRGFQTRIIARIREKLGKKITRELNNRVERTMGYSDNLEALRPEFGMGREEADSQFIQYRVGGQEDISRRAN